jgi:hypothetical protein
MEIGIQAHKKLYLGVIIFVAVAGVVFFFPMNIAGRYTCFYHRLFDPPQSSRSDVAVVHNHKDHNEGDDRADDSHGQSVLLDNYLRHYALLWWISVGMLAIFGYLFLKAMRDTDHDDSGLSVR